MSGQSPLPPRCPFQKMNATRPFHDPVSPSSFSGSLTTTLHLKSISQSSLLEEQPTWLDDLLDDTKADTEGSPLCRSVSDSVTLLRGLISDETWSSNRSGCRLDLPCTYGPNSPRSKETLALSEDVVVSKLTDYFSRKPTHCPNSGLIESRTIRSELTEDASGPSGVAIVGSKTVKRHPGQRSRVRKLQYIAELERTVNILQSLESDLAIKVASLLQQRVALSMENNKLKQQLARLKQKKVFIDGQCRSLKKDLERLKNHSAEKINSADFRPSPVAVEGGLEAVWKRVDFGSLNLN